MRDGSSGAAVTNSGWLKPDATRVAAMPLGFAAAPLGSNP
jgi:hypothetical protein